MGENLKIQKLLADALNFAHTRALKAREAVEHRLLSLPGQEALVRKWTENPVAMAAQFYPRHEVSSYPVQTRIEREIEKLQRYRDELPERLDAYASALQTIERTTEEIQVVSKREARQPLVPWPSRPNVLTDDPWPQHWPKRSNTPALTQVSQQPRFSFNTHRPLPIRRLPATRRFTEIIAGQVIEFESRYEDGVTPFVTALNAFLTGPDPSRWPAIIEATRCGIRWPQLDRYLQECSQPWLPLELVNADFGLRGTLERRDELADLMAQVSASAGRWYLSQHPGRTRLHEDVDVPVAVLEELMAADLVDWGPEMPPGEILKQLPFEEVKSMLALAGISTPRSRSAQVKQYAELVVVRGEAAVTQWIRQFVDPSTVIEVREPRGWHREDRLGPRARANVMVSTLVLLHEGDTGPRQILNWGL